MSIFVSIPAFGADRDELRRTSFADGADNEVLIQGGNTGTGNMMELFDGTIAAGTLIFRIRQNGTNVSLEAVNGLFLNYTNDGGVGSEDAIIAITERSADPALGVTNLGALYVKDVGGLEMPFWEDSAGNSYDFMLAGGSGSSFFYNVRAYGATGDGSTDDTANFQAAIDAVNAAGGGYLLCPGGTYLINVVIKTGVTIVGEGRNVTILSPVTDSPVIMTAVNVSTVRIGVRDLTITGDVTMTTAQDGIRLGTTSASTWVTNISISNVTIEDCGRYGLYAFGSAGAGPFVNYLWWSNGGKIENCVDAGLLLEGQVQHAQFNGVQVIDNGGIAGTNENCDIDLEGVNSTRVSNVIFLNCTFHRNAMMNNGATGNGIRVNHADAVTFIGCLFENADPLMFVNGSLARSLTITGCNFGISGSPAYNITTGIEIEDMANMNISNNIFGANGNVTQWIEQTTATSRLKNIYIANNRYGGTITDKAVDIAQDVTIATGEIFAYRTFLEVDTESAAASDDLDTISDSTGTSGSVEFNPGQIITLKPEDDTHTIVIKHGTGNINTVDGLDFSMTELEDIITLRWNESSEEWFEVSYGTRSVLLNVVEDTTPQLGGNLDGQTYNITTTGTLASGVATVTGVVNTSVGLDGVGAVDLDYGSADITDHTFISDGGTVVIDGTIISDSDGILMVPAEYATIAAAETASVTGDIIDIATGTYNESLTLNVAGVTIRGHGWDTIINGGTSTALTVTAARSIIKDIAIQSTADAGNVAYGLIMSGDYFVIDNVRIPSSDAEGIRVTSDYGTIQNCLVEDTDTSGINVTSGSQWVSVINNSITVVNASWGIIADQDIGNVIGNRITAGSSGSLLLHTSSTEVVADGNHTSNGTITNIGINNVVGDNT